MNIKTITVEIGATLNTGNYNNLKLSATATADVDETSEKDAVKVIAKRLRVELLALLEDVDCDPQGVDAIAAIGMDKKVSVLDGTS